MVDHYIQLVRNSLAECTADTAEYANALLLSSSIWQATSACMPSIRARPRSTWRPGSPSFAVPAGRGLIVHLRAFDASCIERPPAVSLSVVAR